MMSTLEKDEKIVFSAQVKDRFLMAVRQRVEQYFRQKNLSVHANAVLHRKIILLFSLAIFFYNAILMQLFSSPILLICSMLFGMTSGLIAMNLGHDCLHGAYSENQKMNRFLGYAYDLIGLSSFVWKITHNRGHHIYTNISGMDPDIDKPRLLRLSPADPHYPVHRWQHLYIWGLYSLVSLNWIYYSDYKFFFKEWEQASITEIMLFFLFKVINFTLLIIIPLCVMTLPLWQIIIGYLAYQLAGGFIVALIFQLAHIVEGNEFPVPDPQGMISTSWGEHEMRTTANFGTKNKLLNYMVGGLNFQIEHHLFTNISHVHYPKITHIVRAVAEEYGLPYRENATFRGAVASHWRFLKKLGTAKEKIHG